MRNLSQETEARVENDAKLAAAGRCQDLDQINLVASRGVASCRNRSAGGPVDSVPFVDGKTLCVLEAKKAETLQIAVAEQSLRYSHSKNWKPPRCLRFSPVRAIFEIVRETNTVHSIQAAPKTISPTSGY